jgi:kynurenine 3-monooxygenase
VEKFFRENFPDVVDLIPHLEQQFVENPASPLLTVKCSPWNHEDKVLLIGDAAHATVPFYGQGMNAGFEDCLLFCEILDKSKGNLKETIETFSKERQPAGFALCDLSLQHFKDMSSNTISPLAQFKKKIEATLHWIAPSWWVPEYTMVSFTRTPYHKALEQTKRQDRALHFAALTTLAAAVAVPAVFLGYKNRNKLWK